GDGLAFVSGWFGGADVHAPIEEAGVGGDDFAVAAASQVERESGFTGRGRADDDQERAGRRRHAATTWARRFPGVRSAAICPGYRVRRPPGPHATLLHLNPFRRGRPRLAPTVYWLCGG